MNSYDVIILGAGPAGLTAGIYLSRSKMKTLIVDTGAPGGQMNLTEKVVNYPGVYEDSGAMIAFTMRRQAERFGCEILMQAEITEMDLTGETKTFEIEDEGTFSSKAVIIASGGKPRALGIPGETEFQGRGVSFCATCDGEFFTDKEIAVIGGGNSALEEAVELTKFASKVTIIHEFNEFQAHKFAVEEAEKNPKISFLMNQKVTEFKGDEKIRSVVSKDKETGEVNTTEVEGVFTFIGYVPNTEMFTDIVKMNDRKEIIANEKLETNIPGVYVAGDCREKKYRQITTSVADGTIASIEAAEYINSVF